MSETISMTLFSGHEFKDIQECLESIANCPLPTEVFDAFLSEYKKTGDLGAARFFAQCEWDC
tara:strand:+ start:708 stop:893 length:186 start_codon:yes stop_codon:yes gene_type:complete